MNENQAILYYVGCCAYHDSSEQFCWVASVGADSVVDSLSAVGSCFSSL